jgi:hypothetical protein
MNLVGKIFVVLILVVSLVVMSFVMAVYATHKNWRDVVMNDKPTPDKELGLKFLLDKAEHDKADLQTLKTNLEKSLSDLSTAKQQERVKLEQEKDLALKERDSLRKDFAQLEKDSREAVEAMKVTQDNATAYRKQLEQLRTSILEAQKDRDEHFKEVVRKTDELHQAVNEKEVLKKKAEDLAKDLARAKDALRYFSVPWQTDYRTTTPPEVDAVVLATPGAGLVEISLGADAGLRKGHQLYIYRIAGGQSTYVGRLEVVKAAADKSVCKVDPKSQNSNVTVGDRVRSKLD